MRYSLVFKVKNEMRWVFTDDVEAIMIIASMLKLFHIGFALYDRRTIILENNV